MSLVSFSKSDLLIRSEGGETLLALLRRAGLSIETPCGGLGTCGKCSVLLADGKRVQACTYVPEEDVEIVSLPEMNSASDVILTEYSTNYSEDDGKDDAKDYSKGYSKDHSKDGSKDEVRDRVPSAAPAEDESEGLYHAAVDIGTTTLAAYLLNKEGEEIAVASRLNPQTLYGADVITRAQYVLDHGSGEMTQCIRDAVQGLLNELTFKAKLQTEQICSVVIAGNTCMHHFFLGLPVDTLVKAPYTPAMKQAAVWNASSLGFRLRPDALLYTLPNIAGFVGGDTVAGLVFTRLAEKPEWTLLLDVGTNGEIVLGRQHNLFACSTAAGPAFEGAGITCGMRGCEGAVCGAHWSVDHFELDVLGGGMARGICGSGLLDLCAELLRSGQMDEYGGLEDGEDIRLTEGSDEEGIPAVILTQKDIRQLQLAKAAIAAGIDCLLLEAGIEACEIQQVFLAGAFGSLLNPDSACRIGLLPSVLQEKVKAVGNASGAGAVSILRDPANWEYAKMLAARTHYVELAKQAAFQELFVEHMMFA